MDLELTVVIATAAVSVGSTLVAVVYGPKLTDRIDTDRAMRERSEYLVSHYAEPLARAAFDLQSRLYSISWRRSAGNPLPPDRRLSTLWLFGQYLAWVEILRREVQIINYGNVKRTTELQRHLFEVTDILSTSSVPDRAFRIYRTDQRALGELMVVERSSDDVRRSDSMGYAQFVQRIESDEAFARWFSSLDGDIRAIAGDQRPGVRAILVQHALIELIDFFDPERVRFPDVNERGKIQLPAGYQGRKRHRPDSEVARFRVDADPAAVVAGWVQEKGLLAVEATPTVRIRLPRRRFHPGHDVVVAHSEPWVEIHVVPHAQPLDARYSTPSWPDQKRRHDSLELDNRAADCLNDLLRRFGRPAFLS